MRHLSIDRLPNLLKIASHVQLDAKQAANYELGLTLLPINQRAEVLVEQAAVDASIVQYAKAVDLYHQALKLQPDYTVAMFNLARILSTAPDASLRNGPEALGLANKASQLSPTQTLEDIDVLACANAEIGRFDDAIFYEQQAVQMAQNSNKPDQVNVLTQRLELFKKHQAFHET